MNEIITKRNGNGQTECIGCKEKGKFALNWDSWLYNFNDKPYCKECLFEKLQQSQNALNEIRECCEDNSIEVSTREYGNLIVTNTEDILKIIDNLGENNENE